MIFMLHVIYHIRLCYVVLTICFLFVCTKMSTTTNSDGSTCSSESESEVESNKKKMKVRRKRLQQYMHAAFVVATHNEKYLCRKKGER